MINDIPCETRVVITCPHPYLKLKQLERIRSEIPPAAPWLLVLVIHIRSQVKTSKKIQSYKFKKIAKKWDFVILQETIHATYLHKLLDKMYIWNGSNQNCRRYRADVWCGTDAGWTDGQTDGRSETNIPSNNFVVRGV